MKYVTILALGVLALACCVALAGDTQTAETIGTTAIIVFVAGSLFV